VKNDGEMKMGRVYSSGMGFMAEVEVYNSRGWHLGVMHPITGDWIKPAVKGRKIDV
jgi:hypothetical protein